MQWTLTSTPQHNKFLEQTRTQLWMEGPLQQSSHSNSDHQKPLCVQTLRTHRITRCSPEALLSFYLLLNYFKMQKMQTTSFLLSLSFFFSPSRLTVLPFPRFLNLKEQHNCIKWKAIVSSLYLGFSAHLAWQKDCDKIFCAFQLCTEWQCSLLDKLTSLIKLSIEF